MCLDGLVGGFEGQDRPTSTLTCSTHVVPMADLFRLVSVVPTPNSLIQELDGWPAVVSSTGRI